MKDTFTAIFISLLLFAYASFSHAGVISWTDWTSATSTTATGTVSGITVDFSGPQNPASQTSGGGTNFWAFNSSIYRAPGIVDNGPEASTDIVRITNATSYSLQFSQAVVDPVMAILSLGRTSLHVSYDFGNIDFDILNSGRGHWGGSTSGSLFEDPGNILRGVEGHGIIQFKGTFSSISWTSNPSEYWHGFQIGIADVASVPEPVSLLLMGLGLFGLAFRPRRR